MVETEHNDMPMKISLTPAEGIAPILLPLTLLSQILAHLERDQVSFSSKPYEYIAATQVEDLAVREGTSEDPDEAAKRWLAAYNAGTLPPSKRQKRKSSRRNSRRKSRRTSPGDTVESSSPGLL